MSATISIYKPQILHFHLPPIFSHKTYFHNSTSLLPLPRKPTFSLLPYHRPLPLQSPKKKSLPRFSASILAQDPNLDGFEEEIDDAGIRGSDWGQQEEVSDEEEPRVLSGEGCRVFVGNLPFDVGSDELGRLFEQAGEVEVAEVIYNRETDRSRGFGFVTLRTVEEADKAINMFSGYDLGGRLLAVNKASRRGSQPIRPVAGFGSRRRIFVGNLPWEVDGARLEQLFEEHGKVLEAQVIYEKDTGRSRGFGFVKMSTDKEIDDAIASLDGKSLDGRPIRVSVAEERRRSF